MSFAARQFVALVTSVFVFITSVNCVCQGSLSPVGTARCQDEPSSKKSCCQPHRQQASHDAPAPSHEGSGKHDPACNHCRGMLMAVKEPTSTQNISHLLAISDFVPVLDTNLIAEIDPIQLACGHRFGDLSPPTEAPTLLSLSCALTL